MNVSLLIAAIALLFIGVMHTVVAEWKGERRLVWRIQQLALFESSEEKDLLAKRIVRLAWHLTSLVWCGLAGLLAYIAFLEPSGSILVIVRILAVVFLLHSALSLAIARGRHASWLGFLLVAAFSFLGTVSF